MSKTPKPPWETAFIRRMKRLREKRGTSQADLAKRVAAAGLPFHQPTVQRIESGSRPVRLNEAVAIAGALDGKLEDMMRPDTLESASQELRNTCRQVGGAAWNYGHPPLDNIEDLHDRVAAAGEAKNYYIAVCQSLDVEPDAHLLKVHADSEGIGRATINQLVDRAKAWELIAAAYPDRSEFPGEPDDGNDYPDYWSMLQDEMERGK